jgi:hypothetical protein
MFAALCFNRFFPQVHYCNSLALEELKLHTLRMRRHRLDALFLIQVYLCSKFCPSDLEIVALRVPARNIRDFALFGAARRVNTVLSAKYASADIVVSMELTCSGRRILSFIIFYNMLSLLLLLLYVCVCTYEYYSFSLHNDVTIAN